MEFCTGYLKYTVYLHHFSCIYPSIIYEQTTSCILELISRSRLLSGNWKQASAELQKSLWLPRKISVWWAINCSFSEETPLFTITGFNDIDDTETLIRISVFLAGSTGLELRDAHSVWVQKYIAYYVHQQTALWNSQLENKCNYQIILLWCWKLQHIWGTHPPLLSFLVVPQHARLWDKTSPSDYKAQQSFKLQKESIRFSDRVSHSSESSILECPPFPVSDVITFSNTVLVSRISGV